MAVRRIRTASGQEGHDLNDVIRDVLRALMAQRGWSENQAAKALGLKQRSFNRFLAGQHGLRVDSLSKLCAELETNPVALFQAHELYEAEARAKLRFGKDALYDRFRMLLGLAEARDVLEVLDHARQLGAFEAVVAAARAAVEAAKSARRKGIREKEPPKSFSA